MKKTDKLFIRYIKQLHVEHIEKNRVYILRYNNVMYNATEEFKSALTHLEKTIMGKMSEEERSLFMSEMEMLEREMTIDELLDDNID